ncbi:MAG TPA: hypothetical protein VIK53_08590 [Verrucomicrobiae bacterium]
MKTKLTILALAFGASTCLVSAQDGPPPSDNQQPPPREGGPGAPGGFHLLPPRAQEQLQLTDDQLKQIAALETETKAKLGKILTPEQMDQLNNMRPPMRQGGPGGPPNGPQLRGGPGGPGGQPGPYGPNRRGNGPPNGYGNNMPPGPPQGDGEDNNPPPGPPPDGN